ncbi:MAG: DciA family protein [Pseudomonadota bacterium]
MALPGSYQRRKGFQRASTLLEKRIRTAGESRGFAVTRLLTHWAEIVGAETAATARPVKVNYAKGGLGATLTLLTTAAQAPMLQMQLPSIREKVNACYGYNAISRIRITQTAATGFAEGQAAFTPAPTPEGPARDPAVQAKARGLAEDVADDGLRAALTALGQNVMTSSKRTS